MGCDIHAYAEAKMFGRWIPMGKIVKDHRGQIMVGYVYEGRNYSLFGKLAGVRGGDILIEPRGIPEDVSDHVREVYGEWGCDAHTASHYYLDELIGHRAVLEKGSKEFRRSLEEMEKLAVLHGLDHQEVRMVFWFDN